MAWRDPEVQSQAPDGKPEPSQPRWRQDFPIDLPQDQYVARRDFVKFLVLVSLAFVVGQFWIGIKNTVRRGKGKPPLQKITALADLPVGGTVSFHYPGPEQSCLLLRPSQDQLLAYVSQCTHLMCAVLPQMDKKQLHCPCHAGYFDLASGRPLAGPPRRPLPRVQLQVIAGVVYAADVELRTA